MKRCIIIGGADISNYEIFNNYFNSNDFFIYCDSGLKHYNKLKKEPNLIIGDFDSHENPNLNIETIVLPCEKDDTDTIYATKVALERGFDQFILIGVVGNRLDHTIANLSILFMLDEKNKEAKIIDDHSEMELVGNKNKYIEDKYSFFSLLNISGLAKGITVKNAKYLLDEGKINVNYQYGISNEVLPGKTASVNVKEGKLLLIKVF